MQVIHIFNENIQVINNISNKKTAPENKQLSSLDLKKKNPLP